MKRYFFIILVIGVIMACSTTKDIQNQSKAEIELAADSTEYELIVLDTRFESYLISQPYSKDFYSNEYYKQWNIQYCTEWNIRHANPFRYGDFYETNIPYESNTDYGIDFNFRLYHYFQFIEKEYGIVLIARRGKAVR